MIRFRTHQEINKSSWDSCIENSANGNLTAFSWYLDLVCPGWCALVEDDYANVFPLPISEKAGFRYSMQPWFTQQLGLFGIDYSSKQKMAEFLQAIPSDFKYIDLNFNSFNQFYSMPELHEMINIELDLNRNYSEISAAYQTNLKRNLKKAENQQLRFTTDVSPQQLTELFKNNRGAELKQIGVAQYELIQKIAETAVNKNLGEINGVFDLSNQLVAAGLWIKSHKKTVFLFSGLSAEGKKSNAMPWLIDTYIQKHAGKCLTLDFEGSSNQGIARFYLSFGSQKTEYQRYFRNSLPGHLKLALTIYRRLKEIRKK